MPRKAWDNRFYVTIYQCAQQKLSIGATAQKLGVSRITLQGWLKRDPAAQDAWDRGKDLDVRSGLQQFNDFVGQRLPENLQQLWEEIQEEGEDGHRLLDNRGKRHRQQIFIHALVTSNFNVNKAVKMCGIGRAQLNGWRKDPDFQELMDHIEWQKKNFFESALLNAVAAGDTAAIIFANKTLNKDRGYSEKVDVQINGTVQHQHIHAHIGVEELDLPLPVRRQVLEAYQIKKEEIAKKEALEYADRK